EIKRSEHDVLDADRNRRRVGQHPSELAFGVTAELTRFGRSIVDEEDAALGEKPAKMGDLGIGEGRQPSIAGKVGERLCPEGIVIGSNRRWAESRRGARSIDELARPARGSGRPHAGGGGPSGQERPRIEGSFLAERQRAAGPRHPDGRSERYRQADDVSARDGRAQSKSSTFQT